MKALLTCPPELLYLAANGWTKNQEKKLAAAEDIRTGFFKKDLLGCAFPSTTDNPSFRAADVCAQLMPEPLVVDLLSARDSFGDMV